MKTMNKRVSVWQINKFTFLKDTFLTKIRSGEWEEGNQIPSEKELAKTYNVNVNTISKVITSLEAEGYLRRVHGIGTFVLPKPERSYQFCVILPEFSFGIGPLILSGIVKAAFEKRVSISIRVHHNRSEEGLRIVHELISGPAPDGVIIIPPQEGGARQRQRMASILLKKGIKIVVVDRKIEGFNLDAVLTDNFKSAFEVASHLINIHKFEKIWFVSERLTTTVRERERGYRRAMECNGLEPIIFRIRSSSLLADGYRLIKEKIEEEGYPEAVFTINDLIGMGVEYALLEKGVKIGEDVALVGFDDLPLVSQLPVPLTTVRQPFFEEGEKSVELLFNRVENPHAPLQEVVLPSKLVLRGSCGCKIKEEVLV